MTSRERFLTAANCGALERPPVWIMRQAGRYLPEYRKLKESYSFTEMVKSPELATEVTLQPLRRYALDAAILFSDILVIPEAMGQPYHFRDTGGIGMDYVLETEAQIDALDEKNTGEKLIYMGHALQSIRKEMGMEKALLGFGGSPWTLAAYMTEGGSLKNCSSLKHMFYENRALFEKLMEKISTALIDLFLMQIEHGADALQMFDSAGAYCSARDYEEMSVKWMRRVIAALPKDFPVIIYAKGMAHHSASLIGAGAKVLSVDWTVDLPNFHNALPEGIAVQGNLDPSILDGTAERTIIETTRVLESMRGHKGHIFNLGHGILPTAKPENVAALVETITNFR
ncbi:uroporphyrinogen decarboxylase [Rubritalea squalenifaciens DSM 18772]|uniref:Uroporphyrinogen decarboxylase n=2 Tax=Rubritalea TaxID=361050 RepID=A0A1M6KYX6_9BACT|nr:uroporphyrinogen decarboxylase [Rubritalea squalenifaciens]SHJ64138.1 uroporphyrinogen decarboxylase [Rubritalea squalenifaciens DSM 18772]